MKKILFSLLSAFFLLSLCSAQVAEGETIDTNPIFAKGKMSLDQFFKIYLNYPEQALTDGTKGTVMVSITVEKDGEPTNPQVVKGVDPLLDAEALRVVSLFPYFTPATKNGEFVKTNVSVPVKFGVADETTTETYTVPDNTEKFPLYVIDGKIVNENLNVNAEEIESIRVMKGKKAIEKYGDRAIDGAIIITTKRIKER